MRALGIGLLVVCATSGIAAANPLEGIKLDGWYGKVGLETGVVFARDRGTAPLLGGVATLVKANDEFEWFVALCKSGIQRLALPRGARVAVEYKIFSLLAVEPFGDKRVNHPVVEQLSV